MDSYLQWKGASRHCIILSIGQRSLTCPVISSSVTEHGGGLHASSDCMLQCCRCRPGHLVRDICKHQLFVTLQHCLSSGEQLEVCGGYRLVHIKYHIKEIFHFFTAAVILTSRLHEFSNRYKDLEKFCTQDLFINLLYRTLNLWRSYEGWDLSSSIKGLFYYQHVDCGYYCVACRCIVCGHCSSHQPTDQRGQVADCRDRAPCCSAAVSPGSCSLLLHIMRS